MIDWPQHLHVNYSSRIIYHTEKKYQRIPTSSEIETEKECFARSHLFTHRSFELNIITNSEHECLNSIRPVKDNNSVECADELIKNNCQIEK